MANQYQPCVLVLREKHHTYHFHADSKENLDALALTIIRCREKVGYYAGKDQEAARGALTAKDGRAAMRLLLRRREHEYEGFDLLPYDTSYVPS